MSTPTSKNSSQAEASSRNGQTEEEEGLRHQLRDAMQSLKRREPLDPTYKRLLLNGGVTPRPPVLPKDKSYKRLGSNLRARVETFLEQTQGKDPFDRISQRQPLQDEHMRAALTLREAKKHEQKALLQVSLSALPKRNGMDATTRRRHLESIVLGLQVTEKKHVPQSSRAPVPTTAAAASSVDLRTEQARQKAHLEAQKTQARAREEARKRQRQDDESRQREDEIKRHNKNRIETPQQTLYKVYYPIFKALWDMEFPNLSGTNPFRIVIDRNNCASIGAADYFDVIEKPMNLTYIQQKVDAMEYSSLQAFLQDVELMISNALLYNSAPTNPYRIAAEEMKKMYVKTAKKVIQSHKKERQQGVSAVGK